MSVPTGVVTFLFTDVEGSTRLWAAGSEAMSASLALHDEILRGEIASRSGFVFTTAGDAFCAAFDRASDGVAAAQAIQQKLAAATWSGPPLKVRIGLHLGEAEERGGDYFGPVVNVAARIEAAGHGGQTLVSDLVHDAAGVSGKDLGHHRLKDVSAPVHLWQLGDEEFASLRTNNQSNLPVPLTKLIDRADDVRAVRLLLREHRLVTIAAVGGTGKTRLAIAVGDAELTHWRDGVWFVDLTKANDDKDVGPAIAGVLGLELRSGEHGGEIARYLSGRELLLVLDNCEHVVEECAEVIDVVLSAGGSSAVLATSREWLDIDGERVYQVASLNTDDPDGGAMRLFVDRACAIAPGFELDDSNRVDVQELCRRLDGVPLALELAASRVAVLSPAELVKGLDDRFRLLSGGRRRQRRRTLEATIDWSYDLLEAEEQRVFRSLGVFAGSFGFDAVAAVCDLSRPGAVDAIESLYSRSLVGPATDDDGRFRLLETLKAYAEDRLLDAGEASDIREKHCKYFVEFAGEIKTSEFDFSLMIQADSLLWPDRSNFYLAADWLESDERWDELAAYVPAIVGLDTADSTAVLVRVHDCIERVEDSSLIDELLVAQNFLQLILADWKGYSESARAMRRSSDALVAATGYLMVAVTAARHDPAKASAMVDLYLETLGNQVTEEHIRSAELARNLVAAFDNDLEAAVTTAVSLSEGEQPNLLGISGSKSIIAVAGWVNSEPHRIYDVLNEFESTRVSRPGLTDHVQQFCQALAALADPERDGAIEVRALAISAAAGRLALLHSGALTMLAAYEMTKGENDLARTLIRGTGSPRDPSSTLMLRQVAERLGIGEEIEAAYLQNMTDHNWMTDRPARALQAELKRRGWSEN